MNIRVSVVMSVYNAEIYLTKSIESILNQTFSDFEFIIINDGSTDNSLNIIRSFNDERIVLINQENTGLAKALNNGINIAKADYIARMDADDISLPTRLVKQYDFLMENPEYVVVGCNAKMIDVDGNFTHCSSLPLSNLDCKNKLPETPFIHPSVMLKKNAVLEAGKYCEAMVKSQDTVLFNRMAKYGKFHNLKEALIKYRIVPTANSTRSSIIEKRYYEIVNKAIETNKISLEDKEYLKSLTGNRNSSIRLANYHLYLAKKYLWNNYQPNLARRNLIKSLGYRFNKLCIFYYFVSFLPKQAIQKLYNGLK